MYLCWASIFNHPNSWYKSDNYKILIIIIHFLLDRSTNIIMDHCYNRTHHHPQINCDQYILFFFFPVTQLIWSCLCCSWHSGLSTLWHPSIKWSLVVPLPRTTGHSINQMTFPASPSSIPLVELFGKFSLVNSFYECIQPFRNESALNNL